MYFVFNRPLDHFDNRIILEDKSRRAQAFWTKIVCFLTTADRRLYACSVSSMKRNMLLCFRLVLLVALNFRQQKKENLSHKLYSWYCIKIKHDKIVWKNNEIATGSDHIKNAEQEPQCTHAEHFLGIRGKDEVTVFFPGNQEMPKYFHWIPLFFFSWTANGVPSNMRKQWFNKGTIFQLTYLSFPWN